MSEYLAPNGKPSNLTPEQYKLVRTPEFKEWFGDWENDPANASKVVDENGEPLVCYHGTTFDFNIFEKTIFGKFGKGMYFTSYFNFAKKYAKNYDESRIIPVFLKAINLVKTEEGFLDQIKNIPKNYDGIWSSLVWTNDYEYDEIGEDEIIVYSPNQIKLADGSNTTFDGNNTDIRFKKGGRTIAQTPAPKKERIYGSEKNKPESSKDTKSAKKIKFSEQTLETIKNKVAKHNENNPNKKVNIASAKAVVRRGMGAYSSSHRPTIKGGKPNSRVAWGLARLNAFFYKIINGKSQSGKYNQDDDLINELGYKVAKYEIGGIFQGTPYDFNVYSTEYIGTGEGNQAFGWGLYFTDNKEIARYYMSAGLYDDEQKIILNSKKLSEYNVEQEVKDQLVGIIETIFGEDKLVPTIPLIKDYLVLEYDEENYPELKELVELCNKTYDFIKDKKLSFIGNIYYVTLFKGKNPNEYDLLEWEKKPTETQILKIKNQAKKDGIDLSKLPFDLERYRDSNAVYNDLSYIISGIGHLNSRDSGKICSEFLLRAGIDGVKYKAGTLSGFEDEEGYNYVIFDANDTTIEGKEKYDEIMSGKEKYVDGGDIQAYKEAMDISEYADGGETKPKKVYVSIKLNFEIEGKFGEYFYKYEEKPFEELKNGVLEGLVGVSTSPNNIAEWFINRDCLIVMNYDEFMNLNDTETINYDDPNQLMKNNLFLFKRLYANITRYGEQAGVYIQTLTKLNEKIIPEIRLEMNVVEGQKFSELRRISRFLNPYETSAFTQWIENNKLNIESPEDLTNAILDFNKLNDNFLGDGFKNPVLTFDELFPLVEKGIKNAGKIYESEQEVVLLNKKLLIPKNSQLFFIGKNEVGKLTESNKLELIEKYQLKDTYKIYFVDRVQLEKYRSIWIKKEEEKFKNKSEEGKKQLEIKKEKVTNELLSIFLNKSLNSIKEQYEKDYINEFSESKMYYDTNSDDYQEVYWYSIPLVKKIFNFYIESVKTNWNRFIELKKVPNLNLYSFSNFCGEVKYEINDFFEKNRDEFDKLNDWKEINGNGWLNSYGLQKLLKTSVDDYENLPEWITYKKLSKMYLEKMGGEIYRYYDVKDVPLISNYEDGGKIEIPDEFWGNEAGGVLIYCRKTKRYLLLERSKYVNEPYTWNLISGKIEEDEAVKDAVIRECFEEIGVHLSDLIPIYKYETDDFIFHNFLSVVDDEFHVDFNWESADYGWFYLEDFPKKLHFGLKILLESVNLIDIVNSTKEYYQKRNIGGGIEYYKRKGIEHWVFTTKEDFEKNAQENNTIEF